MEKRMVRYNNMSMAEMVEACNALIDYSMDNSQERETPKRLDVLNSLRNDLETGIEEALEEHIQKTSA